MIYAELAACAPSKEASDAKVGAGLCKHSVERFQNYPRAQEVRCCCARTAAEVPQFGVRIPAIMTWLLLAIIPAHHGPKAGNTS